MSEISVVDEMKELVEKSKKRVDLLLSGENKISGGQRNVTGALECHAKLLRQYDAISRRK